MEVVLLGETSREYMEKQAKIVATAAKLSRFDGNVLEIYENLTGNYEENVNFIKRVIKMGHDSIIDHDYVVFALKDVSMLVEQTIIKQRICSFTIKSRREVNFSNAGYYVPTFLDENNQVLSNEIELQNLYREHIDSLFQEYNTLIEKAIKPEDARYILPYSIYSNIVMGLDVHALKDLIIDLTKGKNSNITELKEFGNQLYEIVKTRCEYIKDKIDISKRENIDYVEEYLNNIMFDKEHILLENELIKPIENPILLSSTSSIDRTLFLNAIMRVYGCSYENALELYDVYLKKNNIYKKEIKNKLMQFIYKSQEELKSIHFSFQIPISLANLTHLTRHRTIQLLIPDFVPIKNLDYFQVPDSIRKIEYPVKDIFKRNKEIYQEFKHYGVRDEDLIYFYLNAHVFQVIANMDGKTLSHFLKLRCCNKAQWEIREIANEIRNLIVDHSQYFPQILGPTCEVEGKCYEGKESCGKVRKYTLKKNNI